MSYTEPRVRLHNVSKSFGKHEVFSGLDLEWGPGIVALLGPNGAGKTTMIKLLATLLRPDSGRVEVLGHDTRTHGARVRGLIGVTGQFSSVDEVLTGRENLLLAGQLMGLGRQAAADRATELLARHRLSHAADTRAGTWSGGMKRRLDLAVSLVRRPALLFLDEPTTGLDTASRQDLWDQVAELAEEGTSILLTTQYLEEADALAREVLVLGGAERGGGAVVARGTPAELKALAGGPVVEAHRGAEVLDPIATDGTARDLARIASTLPPDAVVTVRRPTLDEAFTRLTSPAARTELKEAS